MQDIVFAAGTRAVVAEKDALTAISPAHHGREAMRRRAGISIRLRRHMVRQPAHQKDEGIERMDAVGAEPGGGGKIRTASLDRLVEHGLGEMPAGETGALAGLHDRRIKAPVMTADGDHLLLL